jgi:hypothetical protein
MSFHGEVCSLPTCPLTVANSTLAIPSHVHQWRGSVDRSSSEWFVGYPYLIALRQSCPSSDHDRALTLPRLSNPLHFTLSHRIYLR